MNYSKTKNALVLAVVTAVFWIGAAAGSDRHSETYDVKPGQKLEIDCEDGGGISVSGWDKNQAEIRYSVRNGDLDSYDIEIRKTRSGLKITASVNDRNMNNISLHFDIRLPREFDVEFHSAGGGLELSGLEGEFSGKTMGGGITLHDLRGEAELVTMGGRIRITDSELDGSVHTMGGRVLVENVVGDVRASSNGGSVTYRNVRGRNGDRRAPGHMDVDDIEGETVLITSMGGSIDVTDAPEGASVSTAGGRVRVTGARRFVDAATGGGDMRIEVTNGWVKATTGAGDIDVVIREGTGDENNRSSLFSGLGDIVVQLPPDASVEFDIELGYTRNSRRDFKIITDFDIEREYTDEWDSSHGSPRKFIYGTGSVAGGKHLLRIRTTNGDVRIIRK
jgi:DUF4097 and DUF4098 domain-containing protein YvlB